MNMYQICSDSVQCYISISILENTYPFVGIVRVQFSWWVVSMKQVLCIKFQIFRNLYMNRKNKHTFFKIYSKYPPLCYADSWRLRDLLK